MKRNKVVKIFSIVFIILVFIFCKRHIADGKEFFNHGIDLVDEHCISCHHINYNIGNAPPFKGLIDRRDLDWISSFIVDGHSLYLSGDSIAVSLYKEHNNKQHPEFYFLNKVELKSILYVFERDFVVFD